MTIDVTQLKHEIDQLGDLDDAATTARAARVAADTAAQTANSAFTAAQHDETAANAAVSQQIAYITGLLGTTPAIDDPTPDAAPTPPSPAPASTDSSDSTPPSPAPASTDSSDSTPANPTS